MFTVPHGAKSQGGSSSSQVAAQDHIQVPWIGFQPCELLYLLRSDINPLQESDYLESDIYARVINIVGQHFQGCNDCKINLNSLEVQVLYHLISSVCTKMNIDTNNQ